jgi:cystathionine beta-lyase
VEYINKNIPQINVQQPEATYLLWLDFSSLELDDVELNKFIINKAGLGLNQGSVFGKGGKGFMRMNLACTRKTLEKALVQLSKAISQV